MGDRVRTAINPDCPFQTECHGSYPEFSGRLGRIVAIESDQHYPDHPCVVKYEGWEHGKHTYCARFAESELEPAEAAS